MHLFDGLTTSKLEGSVYTTNWYWPQKIGPNWEKLAPSLRPSPEKSFRQKGGPTKGFQQLTVQKILHGWYVHCRVKTSIVPHDYIWAFLRFNPKIPWDSRIFIPVLLNPRLGENFGNSRHTKFEVKFITIK